jgi:hypothetical protein
VIDRQVHQENLEAAFYKLMLDLQSLVEESNYRFVVGGLSSHLRQEMRWVRLCDQFDTFASREAALREPAPEDAS